MTSGIDGVPERSFTSLGSITFVGWIMGISSLGMPSSEMVGPPRTREYVSGVGSLADRDRWESVRSSWLNRRRLAWWELDEDAAESSLLSEPLGVDECLRFIEGVANHGWLGGQEEMQLVILKSVSSWKLAETIREFES